MLRSMPRVWALLIVLAVVLSAKGEANDRLLILDDDKASYAVGPYAEVFEDKSRRLNFDSVRKAFEKGRFQPELQELPNYGFTGHAYWFHVRVKGEEGGRAAWFLALEYPPIDKIDIYYQTEKGSWQHKASGDRRAFASRDLKNRHFYFELPVSSQKPTDVFVRLQTDGSSQFLMYFKTLKEIMKVDHESQYVQGFHVGLLAVMIAYYFLMALGARSLENLSLTVFLFALLLFKMTMNGHAFEYLWSNAIWWANASVAFAVPFVFFAALLNAYSFLPVKTYPRLKLVYLLFIGIVGVECLASFFLPYIAVKACVVSGLFVTVLIFSSSIFMLIKGYKPARFFMLAWVSLLIGALLYGIQKMGWIPVSFWTLNGVDIATAMLAVLLSIGAADKVNEINKQIRRAQKATIQAQVEARRVIELMNTQLEAQVKERTEKLRQQTKDMGVMLSNIQQGICTLDGNGRINKEYSSYLERILNRKNLEGQSLLDLLFKKSDQSGENIQMVRSILQSCMAEDAINFDVNSHLLPRHIQLHQDGQTRELEIEWASIEDADNRILKVLTAIRDVTEIKKAEAIAAARQRELEIMGRILDLPASKFKRFVQSTQVLLQDCYNILSREDVKDHWQTIVRNAHTIKGNARAYGLDEISRAVHQLENNLFTGDQMQPDPDKREFTVAGLKRIEELLNYYLMLHDEKLKRSALADFETAMVSMSALVVEHKDHMSTHLQKEFSGILKCLDRLNVNTFYKALQPIISSLDPLAEQLGKRPPQVLITGPDFYVDPEQTEMLEGIFIHAFRNSLDHGFGSGDQGEIRLTIHHDEAFTEITYSDNGKGLNLPLLQRKAIEKGLITEDATAHEVALTIFEQGISTAQAVAEISGRGVGMDAVLAFAKLLGGDVDLILNGPSRLDDYGRFHLKIRLPPQKRIAKRSVQLAVS